MKVSDLVLIAILIERDFPVLGYETITPSRFSITFATVNAAGEDGLAICTTFYADPKSPRLSVNPTTFYVAIRKAKDLIYNIRLKASYGERGSL